MKIALEYSGFLRFIQHTYPMIQKYFISNENIEFYIFIHTWDTSREEDIAFMKNTIKPHRYFIDTQKNFERHPYQLMNMNMTHEEYKNNPDRLKWNLEHPNDVKRFFEKPSSENNYKFDTDLEVVKFGYYSHYPFNTLSLFYSIHQVGQLRKSYAQEHNIEFDYVVRFRSDMHFTQPIYLDSLNKEQITVFDASPHNGDLGKYTTQDQFAISSPKIMNIFDDIFIYLPCYYFMFELDWVSEILVGFHLQYNKIPIYKIPRHFRILRYPNYGSSRPTQ